MVTIETQSKNSHLLAQQNIAEELWNFTGTSDKQHGSHVLHHLWVIKSK
jgi:hypothetical protein